MHILDYRLLYFPKFRPEFTIFYNLNLPVNEELIGSS